MRWRVGVASAYAAGMVMMTASASVEGSGTVWSVSRRTLMWSAIASRISVSVSRRDMRSVPPEAPAVLVEEGRRVLLKVMVAALPHGVWTEGKVLGSHPYRLIHRYGRCGDAELQGGGTHPHHPDAESFLPASD